MKAHFIFELSITASPRSPFPSLTQQIDSLSDILCNLTSYHTKRRANEKKSQFLGNEKCYR